MKPEMKPREHTLADGRRLWVREAESDDAPGMVAYLDAVGGESDFLTFGPGQHGSSEDSERRFIAMDRERENCLFLVGVVDFELVAALTFVGGAKPRTSHTGEFGLSVRKAWWGIGVGSVLLDTLVRWAKTNPAVAKINLRVRTDNERAIRLYERTGFTHEGTIRKEMRIDGRYFDQHWMGLDV